MGGLRGNSKSRVTESVPTLLTTVLGKQDKQASTEMDRGPAHLRARLPCTREVGLVQGWPHQAAVRGRAVSTPQDPLQGPRQAATSPPPPSHYLQPFIGSQESRPLCPRGSTVLSTKSRDSEREAS